MFDLTNFCACVRCPFDIEISSLPVLFLLIMGNMGKNHTKEKAYCDLPLVGLATPDPGAGGGEGGDREEGERSGGSGDDAEKAGLNACTNPSGYGRNTGYLLHASFCLANKCGRALEINHEIIQEGMLIFWSSTLVIAYSQWVFSKPRSGRKMHLVL